MPCMKPSVPENPTEDDVRRLLELMTIIYTNVGSNSGMRVRVVWHPDMYDEFFEPGACTRGHSG